MPKFKKKSDKTVNPDKAPYQSLRPTGQQGGKVAPGFLGHMKSAKGGKK